MEPDGVVAEAFIDGVAGSDGDDRDDDLVVGEVIDVEGVGVAMQSLQEGDQSDGISGNATDLVRKATDRACINRTFRAIIV
jgi:hypothetical protein